MGYPKKKEVRYRYSVFVYLIRIYVDLNYCLLYLTSQTKLWFLPTSKINVVIACYSDGNDGRTGVHGYSLTLTSFVSYHLYVHDDQTTFFKITLPCVCMTKQAYPYTSPSFATNS